MSQFDQAPVTDAPLTDEGEVDVDAIEDQDTIESTAAVGDTFEELEQADGGSSGGGSGGAPLGSRQNPRPR